MITISKSADITLLKRRILKSVLLFAFLSFGIIGQAQVDSSSTVNAGRSEFRQKMSLKWNMEHSPLKATLLSAALPGAGQYYNKKYWKMPIVYAGLGTCIYFIQFNNSKYNYYKGAYILQNDGDASTNPSAEFDNIDLDAAQEYYHKMRDISYMSLVGVYVLQIIDANVDAHLFHFDVSPDLSLNIHPNVIMTNQPIQGLTIGLHF